MFCQTPVFIHVTKTVTVVLCVFVLVLGGGGGLKEKVKVFPLQATKALRVGRGIVLPNSGLGPEDGGGRSAPRLGRFTPGKDQLLIGGGGDVLRRVIVWVICASLCYC